MSSELRKNLEHVIGVWNLGSSSVESDPAENESPMPAQKDDFKVAPHYNRVSTGTLLARSNRTAYKSGFSVTNWLMSGLREDSLAAVLVFGLILYSAIAACAASGLMLTASH